MAVFMTGNGVLSMGNKTPVTILQETLHRRGINPHYELIYNGAGTVDPLFKFRVSATGLTAIGEGKSKKEAKHDAAAALLKRMQTKNAVTENSDVQATEMVDIASPYTGALKQNFVGLLDDVCVVNKIPLPFFIPMSEDGPPHARVFTIQCKVSTSTETAVARTKKQAKHMAAQQMVTRIADILGDKFIPVTEKLSEVTEPVETMNLKAIESGNFRHDMSTPISDFHNVFHHRTDEFVVPKMFSELSSKPEEFYEQIENPKEFLDKLLQSLEGTSKIISVPENLKDEMFWCGEEDWSEKENIEDYSSDEDTSHLGKYTLEEFDLGDCDERLSSTISIPADTVKRCSQEENNDLANCKVKLKEMDVNVPSKISVDLSKAVTLFLSVVCPQGTWAFCGSGDTCEEAVHQAAVEALRFFRLMSIPRTIKSTEKLLV